MPGVDLSFDAATKIPAREYKGWVVWPDAPVSSCRCSTEDYFRSVDDVIEACAEDGIELPAFVWATSEMHLGFDANYVLESALEEHHEDAIDGIPSSAIDDLQALLDAWAARPDTEVTTYVEDRTRAVVFGDEEARIYKSLRAASDGVSALIDEVTR